MGTRNLTVVKNSDGEVIVAQYGQWDGYPAHTGRSILEFLSNDENVKKLKAGLHLTYPISDVSVDKLYKEIALEFPTENADKLFGEKYPSLTRDTGWEILQVIRDNVFVPIVNNIEFADDALFCEGYYEINFETNKFISKYNGITKTYSLDNLPPENDYLSAMSVATDTIAA